MRSLVVNCIILTAAVGSARAEGPNRSDVEFFETHVRPVLAQHCYKCHSATSESVKGGLRLDSREGMLKGGDSGPAVVPGKPEKSLLIEAVDHDPSSEVKMPPKSKLPTPAIADLTSWIARGAVWPQEIAPQAHATIKKIQAINDARRHHWAFQPLTSPAVPAVADKQWVRTPIDTFILATLESRQIKPSPGADRRTLLRRVYLDLIGLPPTPNEQDRFLSDSSSAALEHVVDDLLSRPQYGERWGRHWLDTARFAEANGYEHDEPKPFAWRYRDYVIQAFNSDKPYDRFVTEQLAGDEVENSNAQTQIATSFLRVGPFDTTAADGKLARYDQIDDIVGTTSAAFLGQTLRCARCHDHKFEPFTQTDYYKLAAVFEPLRAGPNEGVLIGTADEQAEYRKAHAAIDAELEPLYRQMEPIWLSIIEYHEVPVPQKKIPDPDPKIIAALHKVFGDRTKAEDDQIVRNRAKLIETFGKRANSQDKKSLDALSDQISSINKKRPQGTFAHLFEEKGTSPAPTVLFYRGDCNKPGPKVEVGVPTVLGGDSLPLPTPTRKTSGRRLWLAQWMTGPNRSLLARVMVNRIWQHHFGTGLVTTSNDFGLHGEPPTHPELLEWLANDFVQNGWTMKRLHRQIILSSVYQTSSAHQTTELADPEGRLLAYWHTRRLESEAVRDEMLAVSGKLNPETYGPSVFPPLTQRIVGDSASNDWRTSDDRQSARRSVYICVKRNILVPELEVMGIADSASSVDSRPVATSPLQSLMLLNSKFANEQALLLAKRVRAEAGTDLAAQVKRAFALTLCREPKASELADAIEFVSSEPAAIGVKHASLSDNALAGLCLVLFNTNEFIYTN